jgi:hypothetical protein
LCGGFSGTLIGNVDGKKTRRLAIEWDEVEGKGEGEGAGFYVTFSVTNGH